MKGKRILTVLCAGLMMIGSAMAEGGITLRTVTCFSGSDPAAEAYVDILREYEADTGNRVEDNSHTSNEAWKTSVLNDFAAGNEPDILFFFAAGADSAPILSRVVALDEINEAYPELDLPETDALREADGRVYAVPTRGFWEGLYVRLDLFEQFGAPMPDSWDSLNEAIRIFRENGLTPISASLSDIPHYVAEMAVISCASAEEQQKRPGTADEVPGSWEEAMGVIRELRQSGAFADNALAMEDGEAIDQFIRGEAAMRMDGSWMAEMLSDELMESVAVLPMPSRNDGGTVDCYIGGVSMGFYLTRKAWNNPNRRDAAVSLLAALTKPEHIRRLGNQRITGRLAESAAEMIRGRTMLSPLQDAMHRQARETWLLQCVPAVAEGEMTEKECWETVMSLNPFGK